MSIFHVFGESSGSTGHGFVGSDGGALYLVVAERRAKKSHSSKSSGKSGRERERESWSERGGEIVKAEKRPFLQLKIRKGGNDLLFSSELKLAKVEKKKFNLVKNGKNYFYGFLR